MKNFPTLKTLTASALLLAVAGTSHGAQIIHSITTSSGYTSPPDVDSNTGGNEWGTLESFSIWDGGRVSDLVSGTEVVYNNLIAGSYTSAATSDYHTAVGGDPTTAGERFGGLDLDTGALNATLTVQFGQVVTDDDLFFIFESDGADKFISHTVQAINSGGTAVGSALSVGNTTFNSRDNFGDRSFLRTDPSSATLTSRGTRGLAYSLADLGLAGDTTVTGFTVTEGGYDPVLAGLAVVPEPGSLALLGLGSLLIVRRRRRG